MFFYESSSIPFRNLPVSDHFKIERLTKYKERILYTTIIHLFCQQQTNIPQDSVKCDIFTDSSASCCVYAVVWYTY